MELYIIRHLQTDWNKQGLLQGSNDIDILPIDDTLFSQIEQQKKQLDDIGDCDHILVSELKRTHQTARAYGFDQVTVEPLINELNFGQFEGKPRQQLLDQIGPIWFDDPRQVVLGESINHLNERIIAFLEKYHHCHRLIIFAHGSWTRAMISLIKYGDLRNMNQVEVVNNQLIRLVYQHQLVHQ